MVKEEGVDGGLKVTPLFVLGTTSRFLNRNPKAQTTDGERGVIF